MDQDLAWRQFTKGVTPAAAPPRITIGGDPFLADHAVRMVSIIA